MSSVISGEQFPAAVFAKLKRPPMKHAGMVDVDEGLQVALNRDAEKVKEQR
jgi:hypothetical protein